MCPKCGATLGNVNIKDVNVNAGFMGNQWRGIAYCCPFCHVVLSVSIDPVALKTDTVEEVLKRLGKK